AIKDTDYAKNNVVLSRFRTIGIAEIKTQGRYFVWPMAIKGFQERPVLGWGQEGFNYVFNKNYNPAMFGQEEWFDRSHNVFLDWLIAGGLVGFISYILLYVFLLYYIYKGHEHMRYSERAILLGMISAYIFNNIFVFDNLISYIMFFSILAFVHSIYADKLKTFNTLDSVSVKNDTVTYIVLPVVVILTGLTIYFVNVPALQANKTLIKSISQQSDYQKNLDYFKQAYSYNSFGYDEITEQLVQAAARSPQNVPDSIKSQFRALAEEKLKEKISKTPHDTRYLVFAGSFFNNQARYSDALIYLNRALEESPKKQTILMEIGTSYLGLGDTAKTLEYFRRAYDLKPSMPESLKILAIGAIYAKDTKTLQEISGKLDRNEIVNDDRFLKAYLDSGDYNTAIGLLNERLVNNPKDVQARMYLASVYASIGQKAKASEVLSSVAKDFPEYKAQIEEYLQKLK
ncbi:MAG: O-antigen ligase family protein, partial [Minisyncoccia bacterium]